ncbi:hypothetical protein LXL04_019516 [Taraxacum kok-saghyz]
MAFGSRSKGSTAAAQNNENTTDPIVVSENEEDSTQEDLNTEATNEVQSQKVKDDKPNEVQSQKVKDDKPLLQEVKIIGAAASKNAGGAKVWVCKHCNQCFTSSYTRIHLQFFGGRKGIQRCSALLKDRVKYEMLLNKVKSAEKHSVKWKDSHYLEMLAPGGMSRKAPNLDKEVVISCMEAFKRIVENAEEEQLLRGQFATFHMKKGLYSMAAAQMDAVTMELAEVAKKVLSQPISSSSAERNWSTYSYIHNVKRNRLNCKRADKLVFIHSNIRLISRFSESYKTGPHKKWDMNPKNAYLEGPSTRFEDMQWENLDGNEVAQDVGGKRQRV